MSEKRWERIKTYGGLGPERDSEEGFYAPKLDEKRAKAILETAWMRIDRGTAHAWGFMSCPRLIWLADEEYETSAAHYDFQANAIVIWKDGNDEATLYHELAHALVGEADHDDRWLLAYARVLRSCSPRLWTMALRGYLHMRLVFERCHECGGPLFWNYERSLCWDCKTEDMCLAGRVRPVRRSD